MFKRGIEVDRDSDLFAGAERGDLIEFPQAFVANPFVGRDDLPLNRSLGKSKNSRGSLKGISFAAA